jgi:YggT family protein
MFLRQATPAQFIIAVLQVYAMLLFIRVICSWIPDLRRYSPVQFLYSITDPYLDIFRKALPFLQAGGIDFSPIVGFFFIQIIIRLLSSML